VIEKVAPPGWVLAVEDGHWLDDASAEVITTLAAAAPDRGWAVLVTSRDAPTGLDVDTLPATARLDLEPLSEESARLIAQGSEGYDLPPVILDGLVARANGNPLFLRELAAAVRAGADPDDLPDRVETLLAARVHALDHEARELVRVTAVLGTRVQRSLLTELYGPVSPALLERCAGVVCTVGRSAIAFDHALVRDAAYESLSFRRRRELHGHAGEVIEARGGEDAAEELALHFSMARHHDGTWRYARIAAERAMRAAAPSEAAVQRERALVAARGLGLAADEVREAATALGDTAELAGRYDLAAEGYREARRQAAGDAAVLAELHRREGWLRERSASYSQALRWYSRGLKLLEGASGSDLLRAKLLLGRGAAMLRQGRFVPAVPVLQDALALLERESDLESRAHCLYLLDWAMVDAGTPDPDLLPRALAIYEELDNHAGQAIVLNNLGVNAYFDGHWPEAVEWYERSRVEREKVGDVVQSGTAANNIGEIRSDQGHYVEALQLLSEAQAIWKAARYPIGIALATSNLGRLAARRGDLDRARDLLAEARQEYARIGAADDVAETDARESERLLLSGEHEAALDLARSARSRAEALGGNPVLLAALARVGGLAHALCGRPDEGLAALRTSLELARRAGAPFEEALTRRALARIDAPDAEEHAAAASALLETLGVDLAPPV
jgi:tetratricopeptide (TPR) repeat protein